MNSNLLLVDGDIKKVVTKKDPTTGNLVSTEWLNDQFKVKAVELSILNPPHKILTREIEGVKETLFILKNESGYEIFIKRADRGYNDKYLKIQPNPKLVGIFELASNKYLMPVAAYDSLVQSIVEDGSKPIKNPC